MTTTTQTHYQSSHQGWFSSTEAWLDARGKGAWIALTVVSFILFWPLGLGLLAYMIWGKRLFSKNCGKMKSRHTSRRHAHYARRHGFSTSGNSAFEEYKAETLRRLQTEQEAFETFLERLRAAKDKSEFDQFMDDRADVAQSERDAAFEAAQEDAARFAEDQDVTDQDDTVQGVEILDEPAHQKTKKKP